MISREENTEAYKELKDQYYDYLENDIILKENFVDFINQSSLESSKSSVKIQVDIYHALGYKLSTKFGSGTIYKASEQSYFILTHNDLLKKTNLQTIRVQVTDYTGYIYTATIENQSDIYQLASLIIPKNIDRKLEVMTISNYQSFSKEPVLLISYTNMVINRMALGLIDEISDDEGLVLFSTNIISDLYGNGGAIINTSSKLVGIQYNVDDGNALGIGVVSILAYLDTLDNPDT